MVFQDRWSLESGSITNVGPSASNIWSFKTGGLSWQWSLNTGFTALLAIIKIGLAQNCIINIHPSPHPPYLHVNNGYRVHTMYIIHASCSFYRQLVTQCSFICSDISVNLYLCFTLTRYASIASPSAMVKCSPSVLAFTLGK